MRREDKERFSKTCHELTGFKCGGLKLEGGTIEENGVDILGGTYTVKCDGLKLEGELLSRTEWTSLEVLILSSVAV